MKPLEWNRLKSTEAAAISLWAVVIGGAGRDWKADDAGRAACTEQLLPTDALAVPQRGQDEFGRGRELAAGGRRGQPWRCYSSEGKAPRYGLWKVFEKAAVLWLRESIGPLGPARRGADCMQCVLGAAGPGVD